MFSSKIIRYFIYAIILITIIFFITIYRVKKQKGKKLRQFFSILLATILIIGILTAYCYAKSRLLSTQIVESFYWEENVTITNKTDNSLKTIFLADTNHTINISDFDIKKNEDKILLKIDLSKIPEILSYLSG